MGFLLQSLNCLQDSHEYFTEKIKAHMTAVYLGLSGPAATLYRQYPPFGEWYLQSKSLEILNGGLFVQIGRRDVVVVVPTKFYIGSRAVGDLYPLDACYGFLLVGQLASVVGPFLYQKTNCARSY